MSRTKRFVGGVTFGYLGLVVTTIAGLWLTPFVLGHLGQREYGLWLVAAQVLGYLALLDVGVVALLPRETAYLTGRRDRDPLEASLPSLLGRTAVIVLGQMPIVAIAALVVVRALPAEWQALRWPLALVLAAFVIGFPFRVFPALLQGLQDLAFLGIVQIGAWLAATALTVALLLSGAGLWAVAGGAVLAQGVTVGAAWIRVRAKYRELLPVRPALGDRAAARRQVANGLAVSISQVAQVLLNGTDLLIVARVFGPSAVVPYSCTGKLVTVLMNQPQVLTAAAGPALSELKAIGDREQLRTVSGTLSLATMVASGAVFCAVLAVNRGFVTWWVGAGQYSGRVLTWLFLAHMLFRHLNVAVSYTLFSFGYERRLSLVGLADGVVTIAAALVLVHVAGPAGAIAGSLAGLSLISLPANLRTLARELGLPARATLAGLGPWAWRFAAIAAVVGLVPDQSVPAGFVRLAVVTFLVLAVYTVVMLPVVARGPLGSYVRPMACAARDRLRDVLQKLARSRRTVETAPADRP